jgi:hypothetical protein
MASGIPNPKGPDKVFFCGCHRKPKLVFLTGTAGDCKVCRKKMVVVAEYPEGTWKNISTSSGAPRTG